MRVVNAEGIMRLWAEYNIFLSSILRSPNVLPHAKGYETAHRRAWIDVHGCEVSAACAELVMTACAQGDLRELWVDWLLRCVY